MRPGEALRGNWLSLRRASNRSSIDSVSLLAIASRRLRRPAYCFASFARRLFFSIELFFAISVQPRSSAFELIDSLPEWKVEGAQESARLRVGPGRRAHDDVHAKHRFRLIVVDLREDDVLLDAESIISAPVEGLRIEAAEVAHARQRHVDETIEEFVHPRLAERDFRADRHVLAHLEGRDRLAGAGDDRLLAGDEREVGRRSG